MNKPYFNSAPNVSAYPNAYRGHLEALQYIQNNNTYKITSLREINTEALKNDYDNLKITFPIICWNCYVSTSFKESDVIETSGYLYFDLDNKDLNKLEGRWKGKSINDIRTSLKKVKCLKAIWTSIGGKGLGFLIKCSKVNKDNFTNVWKQIYNEIKLPLDLSCNSIVRKCFLSYDKDLFINNNCIDFDYKKGAICPSDVLIFNNKDIIKKSVSTPDCTFFHKNNSYEFFTGEYANLPYRIFDEKVKLFKEMILPHSISKGERNSILFKYLSNKFYLCPSPSIFQLNSWIEKFNRRCEEPLKEEEIDKVITSVKNKQNKNQLFLFLSDDKRIVFNPMSNYNPEEKMEIARSLMGQFKSNKTEQTLYSFIEAWDYELHPKLTQQKLCDEINKVNKISLRTIKTYWHKFKSIIHPYKNTLKKGAICPSDVLIINNTKEIDKCVSTPDCTFFKSPIISTDSVRLCAAQDENILPSPKIITNTNMTPEPFKLEKDKILQPEENNQPESLKITQEEDFDYPDYEEQKKFKWGIKFETPLKPEKLSNISFELVFKELEPV